MKCVSKYGVTSNTPRASYIWSVFISLILTLLLGANYGHAADVSLAWDSVSHSSLAGYTVYYGVSSGNYSASVQLGNTTTHTLTGLAEGSTCFVAVTARDTAGNESAFSNELCLNVPASDPGTDPGTDPGNDPGADPLPGETGGESFTIDYASMFDTAANNSMAQNDSLFSIMTVDGSTVFGTNSTQSNIHSHYIGNGIGDAQTYEYTGRMRISSSIGGVGVTFFSQYPNRDAYYRLRRYNSNSFHLSPHGTDITGGVTDTGVKPAANVWYRFRIQAEDTGARTEIRAKVWQDGNSEPSTWQVDAYDSSSTRLTSGTVGVWGYTSGSKYWGDLAVVMENSTGSDPQPVNTAPTANGAALNCLEDQKLSDQLNASDPEGDALTYSIVTNAKNGIVSITNATQGNFSYSPNANFNGTDSFEFKVNDGALDSTTASVSITVQPANDAPLAQNDNSLTDEDSAVTIQVLANDYDIDGNPLSIAEITQPANGSAAISGGAITYAPEKDYHGADAFTYTVSDGQGGLSIATVTITVSPVNDAPVASSQTAETESSKPISGTLSAQDIDGDQLTFSLASNGALGVVQITDPKGGAYTYTPNKGAEGADTFSFRAYDGHVYSNTATVTVTIVPPADSDGDGLTDTEEEDIYGTDPKKADTDGDGLNDGQEVEYWGSDWNADIDTDNVINLLDADSDNDGFKDGVEVTQGFDPADRNTPVVAFAINAGGESFTDSCGITYLPDCLYDGGSAYGVTTSIYNTEDDSLYQSGRYGDFSYNFTLDNGSYILKLRFVEPGYTQPNQRIFDVEVNNETAVTDLDLYAQAGQLTAYDLELPVMVENGALKIGFVGLLDRSIVSALVVAGVPQSSVDEGDTGSTDPDVSDFSSWLDTDANNSMIENDSLFGVMDVNGETVFGTNSSRTNIHSHYMGGGLEGIKSYEYTGRMRMTTPYAGVGVTFFSQFPESDSYYRLRRYNSNNFHLSPHGTNISGGNTDTGVRPTVNVWYRFRIQVEDTGVRTEIRAKVWVDGKAEPSAWQVDAYDSSSTRLTSGTVGVWSYRPGSKYWDDLKVEVK